jgi:amino-acid N-acetyltransferase
MIGAVEITISPAVEKDIPSIKALLTDSGLPTAGVDDHWRTFLVARDGERFVGCGGSEPYRAAALIRSVAVHPQYRKSGVGRQIVRHLIDRLAFRGLRDFYLLTTTAEEFFRKRGFKTIRREEIHPDLSASRELQDACPASAVCMRLVMA